MTRSSTPYFILVISVILSGCTYERYASDTSGGETLATQPSPISGSGIISFDNARLRCHYVDIRPGNEFNTHCRVVAMQPDGTELEVGSADPNVTLTWHDPIALGGAVMQSKQCDVLQPPFSQICSVAMATPTVPMLQFNLDISDGTKTRTEIAIIGFSGVILQNWLSPVDVNANGYVSPADAMQVINSVVLEKTLPIKQGYFLDVNGDNVINDQDANLVTNYLTANGIGPAPSTPVQPKVYLAWQLDQSDGSVTVQRSSNASGPWNPIGSIASTVLKYVDATVADGNQYFYRAGINGNYTDPIGVNVSITPPPVPDILEFSAVILQNFKNPVDTNASGSVSPSDSILVINRIILGGLLPTIQENKYYDVNGDNQITNADAQLVQNCLIASCSSVPPVQPKVHITSELSGTAASGLFIERATDSAGPWTTLATTINAAFNFSDSTVVEGTTYYYRSRTGSKLSPVITVPVTIP